MARTLRVFEQLDALAEGAASELTRQAERSIAARGRFSVALSGGNTPRALYARLAQQPELPWAEIELWLGDERAVPIEHAASNAGMVRAALSSGGIPRTSLSCVRTELPLAAAAADYEQRLRLSFLRDGAFPRFDLVLLGLGADGHTASLFPHAPALQEQRAWVSTHSAQPPPARITLTYPVLNHARAVLFLVAGSDKAEALRRVLEGDESCDDVPARGIQPDQGSLSFFVDRAAASALAATPIS